MAHHIALIAAPLNIIANTISLFFELLTILLDGYPPFRRRSPSAAGVCAVPRANAVVCTHVHAHAHAQVRAAGQRQRARVLEAAPWLRHPGAGKDLVTRIKKHMGYNAEALNAKKLAADLRNCTV